MIYNLTRSLVCILLFCSLIPDGKAQDRKIFLPESSYFEPIILDPLESQIFTSFVKRFDENKEKEGLYVPFSIGGRRMIYRKEKEKGKSWEAGLEVVALTQFEYVTVNDTWKRSILNSDFKIAFPLVWKIDSSSCIRFRIYHLSSHEGDDFIFINKRTSLKPNPVNYEQVELHYSRYFKKTRFYVGAGVNPRIETIRKRLSFQTGFHRSTFLKSDSKTKLFFGTDVKIFEQNEYSPNIKAGAGLEFGSIKPMRIILEYYNGNLPYSMYEYIHTTWFGFGMYMLI